MKRRTFISALAAAMLAANPITSNARGGCGSRGGAGYRKANGKCAGRNE